MEQLRPILISNIEESGIRIFWADKAFNRIIEKMMEVKK